MSAGATLPYLPDRRESYSGESTLLGRAPPGCSRIRYSLYARLSQTLAMSIRLPHREKPLLALADGLSVDEPSRAPDLAPQRERPLELDTYLSPRLAHSSASAASRRTRLMRSQGCQRRASVVSRSSFISSSAHADPVSRLLVYRVVQECLDLLEDVRAFDLEVPAVEIEHVGQHRGVVPQRSLDALVARSCVDARPDFVPVRDVEVEGHRI